MKRRTLVRAGSVGATSLLSGCVGWGRLTSTPGGNVEILNDDDQTHRLGVTLTDSSTGDVAFEQVVEIRPGERRTVSDAFGGGSYSAEITLDSAVRETFQLRIGRCSAITFHVRVQETGELRLSQDHCE